MNQEDKFDSLFDKNRYNEETLPPEPTLEDKYFHFPEEPDEEPAEEPSPRETRSRRGKRAQKKNPVVRYLVILFVVAFLLLLLSFFAQQRDRAALEELQASVGTQNESISDLKEENQKLILQLEEAKKNVEEAETSADDAQDSVKAAKALEYLAQMERACRTSYLEGYRIAQEMESKGLADYLPDTSEVSGCPSPAKVYQDLCSTLFGNLG